MADASVAPPDDAAAEGLRSLCASTDLVDKGRAVVFDVAAYGRPVRAFALRFDGRVVAYLNRCVHVPSELDWMPGEFLDADSEFIMCSTHGAVYEPLTGRCAGGPCGRGRLTAIDVEERDGRVYWRPTSELRPAPPPVGVAPSPPTPPLPRTE